MPISDAVRTSRSPKPNIRPKIDSVSTASLIFSRDESLAFLLITPSEWMSRRVVTRYSWLRNSKMPQTPFAIPNTNRTRTIQPMMSKRGPVPPDQTLTIIRTRAITSAMIAALAFASSTNQCW